VDASAVKVFDSAALAVLLACRRAAQAAGKPARRGSAQGLQSMAALYGVDGLLSDAAHPPSGAACAAAAAKPRKAGLGKP
jgi:phospholipid transport system transporter-binding protein